MSQFGLLTRVSPIERSKRRTAVSHPNPHEEKPVADPQDSTIPLPCEARRQVVVDLLAIAVVDLLLEERSSGQGLHGVVTH
jgi:hypothetical protein